MRVLVTGANGLVGQRLCRILSARGHEVVGVGRGARRVEGPFEYATVELTRREEVSRALLAHHPEVVLNTAAMTEVDRCEREPELAYASNVVAPAELALASRAVDAHLVHVSTDYVFDGDRGPYTEEDIPHPRGVYAVTKHMGEQAVRVLAGSWAIARTAVVYGFPPSARPNFGSWLVEALSRGQEVPLFEDQQVSPSLASNVVAMLAELAEARLTGIWNVCGAEVVDRVTFGRAVCERFGFSESLIKPTRLSSLRLASQRPLRSGLTTTKVRASLKTQPLSMRDGVDGLYAEVKGA